MSFPLIVADESVDRRILVALQAAGYKIYLIAQNDAGSDDSEVIKIALKKRCIYYYRR